MNIFAKIFVLLWLWFRLAVRGVIFTICLPLSPGVLIIMVLGGYSPEKLEKQCLNWLFFGEFKDE